MVLATAAGTRALLSDVGVTIVDDTKLNRALTQADNIVKTGTRKYDWTTDDLDYNTAVSAAEHIASSIVLEGMQDEQNDSREQRDFGRSLINMIKEALAAEDLIDVFDDDVIIERQSFTTRPLNPNAPYTEETTGQLLGDEGIEKL